MATDVDVINNALDRIGTDPITSRAQNTSAAKWMNRRFDNLRDAELCKRWRFAITRVELTASVTVPVGTLYTVQYDLPSDCLQMVQVSEWYFPSMTDYRTGPEAPFVREGRALLTNEPSPLFLRYVKQVTDPTDWDPWFIECLGARLAYEGCERVTGSSGKKQDLLRDYRMVLDEAIAADAIEVAPDVLADESWLIARVSR
jgi:hypothetical protein